MRREYGHLQHIIKADFKLTVSHDGTGELVLVSEDAREWADLYFDDPPRSNVLILKTASAIEKIVAAMREEGLTGDVE